MEKDMLLDDLPLPSLLAIHWNPGNGDGACTNSPTHQLCLPQAMSFHAIFIQKLMYLMLGLYMMSNDHSFRESQPHCFLKTFDY